jgi:hypothetical protein
MQSRIPQRNPSQPRRSLVANRIIPTPLCAGYKTGPTVTALRRFFCASQLNLRPKPSPYPLYIIQIKHIRQRSANAHCLLGKIVVLVFFLAGQLGLPKQR